MKKRIIQLFTLICLVILTSCGATKFETGLKQLQLGMSKQEVVATLGNKYKILGAGTTPEGNLETWRYIEPNLVHGESHEQIIVNFLNGRLDEWHREFLPPPLPKTNSNLNSNK